LELGPDHGVGRVHRGGVRFSNRDCLYSLYGCRHRLVLGEGVGVGVDNVLLRLSLPLPPALVGARVGVLISELVGVGARRRVESVAHPLTVCAPPDPVGPELDGHVQPLVEVF